MSKLASSACHDTPRSVFWEVLEKRSIYEDPVGILDRSSTWMDGIRAYLSDGTLPDSPQEAAVLKKQAARFELKNGELFKAGFLKPLLKCVTPEKGKEVLEDLHSGFCASHIGGKSLAVRARRH